MLTVKETAPGGWSRLSGLSPNRMRWQGCALRETGSASNSSEPGGSPGHRASGGNTENGRWDIPSPGVRVRCALLCGREKQLVLN